MVFGECLGKGVGGKVGCGGGEARPQAEASGSNRSFKKEIS